MLHILATALHYVEVALVFILILSVLVAAHEFGHYIFARLFGMGVEEFSIGMLGNKPLVTYYRRRYRVPLSESEARLVADSLASRDKGPSAANSASNVPGALMKLESAPDESEMHLVETPQGPMLEEETAFTVRPAPIGGFVRIKGMVPQDDGSETSVPGGFYSKAPWKRFVVLLAGPVFSVLAGVAVMIPLFMSIGLVKRDTEPVLGTILEGPAAKAGLKAYDRILSINGEKITDFYQIIAKLQESKGAPLSVDFLRGNQQLHTTLTPILSETPTFVLDRSLNPTGELSRHIVMGANPVMHLSRVGFGEATQTALHIPVETVVSLMGALRNTSTAKDVVGGPGTMIKATSDAVDAGIVGVLTIAAEISISVGIFNLFPIFPLDGGQMAVAVAEMLRGGKRLSIRVQNVVGMVGLGAVVLLVGFALTMDVSRFRSPEPTLKAVSKQNDLK